MNTPAKKRNIVNPYSSLLADIRSFVAQLKKANNPKKVNRGTMKRDEMAWLHECVKTAALIGYRVEVIVKDDQTMEFLMIENTTQPTPFWNW